MLSLNRFRLARRSAEPSAKRSLRERGAAALEFALVAPFFFLVVFGGIELGFMFRNYLALEDASRNASRVAAIERIESPTDWVEADKAILARIQQNLGQLNGDITRVVIYNAPTLASPVPPACVTATNSLQGTNQCNVWLVNNGDLQAAINGTVPAKGLQDAFRGQNENIGVYIEFRYEYVTGFLTSIDLASTSTQVVELNL